MRLNGELVSGRFDESVYRCLVSPAAMSLRLNGDAHSVIIQADYRGTSFTADVSFEVDHIDCDIVVGREWIAFFHLVVDDRNKV
ncbi:hypothetical protein EV363DRAFT_1183345 [Boletus edulis]|nr:hypothetical protein EV363DRAFT_1183345 [Boletus edulis]